MRTQPNPCRLKPQAIIFDFDGVLVESFDVKSEAFRDLLKDYPEDIDAFMKYHVENGGVSRYEKIRFFFKQLRKEPISEQDVLKWCERYGELVVQKVIDSKFVKGAEQLLKACYGRYEMFVVSGTPEEELKLIIRKRKLEHFFKGIFGSPEKKTAIVQRILSEHKIDPKKVVFVGDARTDLDAARDHHIAFIARLSGYNEGFFKNETLLGACKDLIGVRAILEDLEEVNV